jgi:hypothetical protein
VLALVLLVLVLVLVLVLLAGVAASYLTSPFALRCLSDLES